MNNKVIITTVIVSIVIVLIVIFSWRLGKNIALEGSSKNKENIDSIDKNLGITNENESNYDITNEELESIQKVPDSASTALNYINYIMNPLIIAKNGDKWGYVEPTNENIQIAIDSCETYLKSYDGIDEVIKGLNDMLNGNYDKAVEIHNFAWKLAKGDLGEAIGLDYFKIEELKEKNGQ